MFVVKVKKIRLINEINDVSVEVDCYLTCPDGAIYKNSNGGDIKIFKIRVSQSMLSDIVSFQDKLVETAKYIIYNEYHVVGYTIPQYEKIITDSGLIGTPILMLREDDVKQVCVGMTYVGPGYNIEEVKYQYPSYGIDWSATRYNSSIPSFYFFAEYTGNLESVTTYMSIDVGNSQKISMKLHNATPSSPPVFDETVLGSISVSMMDLPSTSSVTDANSTAVIFTFPESIPVVKGKYYYIKQEIVSS